MLLPEGSCTVFAPIEAVTVPEPVMPLTAMLKVVPLFGAISETTAESVPGAVPPDVTSVAVKVAVLIALLNVAVKLIELALVGSVCPEAWLTVIAGVVAS